MIKLKNYHCYINIVMNLYDSFNQLCTFAQIPLLLLETVLMGH